MSIPPFGDVGNAVGNEDGNGVGYNVPRVHAKAAANVIHRKLVILQFCSSKQIFN
jgi:hypothetical protein